MPSRIRLIAFILFSISLMACGWGMCKEEVRQAAIKTKTAAFGNQLAANSQQLEHSANAIGQHIGYNVYQNQFQARDKDVLRQAEQIMKRADAMADSLGSLIPFVNLTDAKPNRFSSLDLADGLPNGMDPHWLQVLARHLDRYAAFIRQYVPDARSLTSLPESQPDLNGFSAYYFQHASEASAQATLHRLIAQVRRYEIEALSMQAQKVGSHCICFDRIAAVAIPASGTVEPGAIYEAQLLLAESFSEFYYKQMCVNSRKIVHFENEQGLVELPIPRMTGSYSDTIHTEWCGLIRASLYPADTTWRLTVPFLVINKPRS